VEAIPIVDGQPIAPEQDAGERKLSFRLIKFQVLRRLELACFVDEPINSRCDKCHIAPFHRPAGGAAALGPEL
jgi:hypothetical protein